MKKLTLYLFLFICVATFSQSNLTISQALNITSKQSMLCERLAKIKIFKATNPNNLNAGQKLSVSLIQFEQNISILKSINISEEITRKIVTLDMLWVGYKKNILDKDYITSIKTLEFNAVMLYHCNDLFKDLLAISEKEKSYPYNTSSKELPVAYLSTHKLKILSQKVALYYNIYYSNIKNYDSDEFQKIINSIDTEMTTVDTYKETTEYITKKTNAVLLDWKNLKSIILKVMDSKFSNLESFPKPEYILNETNKLLKDVDLLARLYKEHSDIK